MVERKCTSNPRRQQIWRSQTKDKGDDVGDHEQNSILPDDHMRMGLRGWQCGGRVEEEVQRGWDFDEDVEQKGDFGGIDHFVSCALISVIIVVESMRVDKGSGPREIRYFLYG